MLWRGPMGGGAASGAIGAMIASHCAQGQYLKTRVKPVNPSSRFQHGTRNAMRQLAVQWGTTLTSTQRDAWATYAANVTWTNRLGDTVHLSGQMEFIRSNLTLQLAGLPFVLDAPVTFDRGDVGGAPTLTLAPGGTLFTLTLNASSPWLSGNVLDGLMVYLSLPRSGGITFFKRRSRFIDRIPGTAAGPVHVFGFTQWPPPDFGQAWTAWVAAQFADGRLTTPVQTNTVLTPPPPPPPWIEPFTYPNGSLNGRDSWTTPIITTDVMQVGSNQLITVANTNPIANCTNPLIGTNWNQPWIFTFDITTQVGTDGADSVTILFGTDDSATAGVIVAFNDFDRGANQVHDIVAVANSTTVSAGVLPWTNGTPQTITVAYDGSQLIVQLNAVTVATNVNTVGSSPGSLVQVQLGSDLTGGSMQIDNFNLQQS